MLKQISFDEVKGYATRENAVKKAEKVLAPYVETNGDNIRYFIQVNIHGRFIPVAANYPGWALASIVRKGVCVI